jgi:DNA-binding response OmpR family regulator
LENSGYEVEWVTTGRAALDAALANPPALVLLDLGLPDIDGVEVCGHLRAFAPGTTIVILTARDDEIDVVVGLDAGADDYVSKPFRLGELLARVRAHLRRPHLQADETFIVGSLVVDVASRRAQFAGTDVELRPKEFDLLAMLASNAGRALTREQIMEEVWDEHWFGSTKTLDMHISALRRKLGQHDDTVVISTLRGVGYRLERPTE